MRIAIAQTPSAAQSSPDFSRVQLIAVNIDGTLTDGTQRTSQDGAGLTQTYHARDGEALKRAAAHGISVVPISSNTSECAHSMMGVLKLPTQWIGIGDKNKALDEVCAAYSVSPDCVAYIGDGPDDAVLLTRTMGCAVADAHDLALKAAIYVSPEVGGDRAVEDIVDRILMAAGHNRVVVCPLN